MHASQLTRCAESVDQSRKLAKMAATMRPTIVPRLMNGRLGKAQLSDGGGRGGKPIG